MGGQESIRPKDKEKSYHQRFD